MNSFTEILSYSFILRALIVGVLVSLCSSLLGVCLVLKRFSMIGDGLSHVGFGAVAIASVLNIAPLYVSTPVVVAAAFLLLRINKCKKRKGDTATALISSGTLAIGIAAISAGSGTNIDINGYMFGSILSLSREDTVLSVILSAAVIVLFVLFYTRIFAVTFDEVFAKATGTNSDFYNMIIAFLTAITIVLGMRMMGTLLISSLVIFPSVTSMRVCRNFKSVIICSAAVSVICFITGLAVSYAAETPTGATVVIINVIMFALFSFIEFFRNRTGSHLR